MISFATPSKNSSSRRWLARALRCRFGLLVVAAAVAGSSFFSAPAAQAADVSLPKVVVALKPDKNPDAMLEEKQALAKYLSTRLGKPVEVIIPLSASTIIEGLANGSIDLGYLSATDMLNARKAKAAQVLLAGEIDGKTSYQSYWLCLKEKPYGSIADLKGKPVAFSSKTSTSGGIIPVYDLFQKKLISEKGDPTEFFGAGNVWWGTGYVSAVERVLSGEAEAAAVSYYVLDKDKHLSAEQRAKLRKFAEQGPVPTHVIAVRATISAADRAALKTALESLNGSGQEALRDKVFTSRLVEVNEEAHLAGLQSATQLVSGSKP